MQLRGFFLCFVIVCFAPLVQAQSSFDWYLSNAGSDNNPGGSARQPKKTIAGLNAVVTNGASPVNPVKIGLRGGDVFNESYAPGFPVNVGAYYDNGADRRFAILNGTDVFDNGWTKTQGASNVFQQAIPITGFTGYGINNVGNYSLIYVFEVDRLMEGVYPLTARRLLKLARTIAEADTTPGSFYEPVTVTENPKTIYIHTTNGMAPNNNPRYRYEVTTRAIAVNATFQENNHFEKIWVRGYGAGVGMIPAGSNSSFNRMIFGPGAGIHHIGCRNGLVENSLFLPAAPNYGSAAMVFYDRDGLGRKNTIRNSIFLDVPYPLYTHTSSASTYRKIELDNVIGFGNNITGGETFLDVSNTDSLVAGNLYISNFKKAVNSGSARFIELKNMIALDVANPFNFSGNANLVNINNSFVRIAGKGRLVGTVVSGASTLMLSNSVLWLKSEKHLNVMHYAGTLFDDAGKPSNYLQVTGNIFVCETDSAGITLMADCVDPYDTATNVFSRMQFKNNVYILLKGSGIRWHLRVAGVTGVTGRLFSFSEWKALSGQDRNSILIDLRNDPRGLKAIFTDPANGDFSLAGTPEADAIRTLRAGMVSPVSCLLKRPTYEEAATIIMNGGVLSANACRNPCLQNNIRLRHSLSTTAAGKNAVNVEWTFEDERNVDHYEILRSFGNNDFTTIANLSAQNLPAYNYTDSSVLPGIEYRYSMVVVNRQMEKCYSNIQSARTEDARLFTVYPNPSAGRFRVMLNDFTGKVSITVHNVTGRVVYNRELECIYGASPEINLAAEPAGMYWINIRSEKGSTRQRLVKY